MTAKNVLFIMSDEHANKVMGCHQHPWVKTPNIDKLASQGCRFTNAYTNSPICLPARAAFATGKYVHKTANWDNAHPYYGAQASWGHVVRDKNVKSVSIGKLHYRNDHDDTGFDEQILPMHIVGGQGDILGSVRDELPVRFKTSSLAEQIGPGESSYTRYDRNITELACQWLGNNADQEQPWVLYVGLVAPHFPLIAPEEFYNLYADLDFPMPKAYAIEERPAHPWLDQWRECWIHDKYFTDEKVKMALASYYGLCSFLDDNIGQILSALEASGALENTQIIYSSDHGDNMGTRGLWGKSTMFEEAAAIPMIVTGPDIKPNTVCHTPVSLVDAAATIVDAVGCDMPDDWDGVSLKQLADTENDPERVAFSEYHAAGAISGAFMIRKGHYKYIHYVGYPAQLFDLAADPEELTDIADKPEMAAVVKELEQALYQICDPEAVDQQAKADQAALVNQHGGREVVVEKGGFGATPAPGEAAKYL